MATKAEDITPTTLADVVPEAAKGDPATGAPVLPPVTFEEKEQDNATPVAESEEKKAEEASAAAAAPTEDATKLAGSDENKPEGEAEATAAADAAAPVADTTGPSEDAKPAESTPNTEGGLVWPDTAADHPLTQFFDLFESLVEESGHDEVFGVKLAKSAPFHTKLILQKFLRANQNDLEKAKQQLLETLKWRKEFDPLKAAGETFPKDKFDGLGYIVEVEGVPKSKADRDVITFNVYGAVKDNKKTFGDLEGFLRWRVALMERSMQKLNLSAATNPIPNFGEGPDPYQGIQIHDYQQVSFVRQDPAVKAATKATIDLLSRHYPETLSRKFFVNVPVFMSWLYSATKLFVAKETAKKFMVLSNGSQVAAQLGKGVPKEYGGDKGELAEIGEGMKLEE
ncbi:CRAL/TRIO domain-containing protein [Massarina eburnea CBS 473.64]|uniref:Phosphatidylinositol transfer protein SFH5 n=1 Tax=Massarina eburnea CBS 473.64 TaxID=1395130 RepID=A0A6A6SBA4_9PLEO|nr:CRAL/TRIO domain-containing protein [Massarina eburnea CBS 473.64]